MLLIVKKTLDIVLEQESDYLVQVKGNSPALLQKIKLQTALTSPISICEYYENANGNEIYRNVQLFENKDVMPKGWNGISRLIKVRRWGVRNKQPFEYLGYYILSKPINSALIVARAIQFHWSIENNLHWVKDAILGEDFTTVKDKNMLPLLSHFNSFALNLLRSAGYKPSKDTFALFANKVKELIRLF